MAEGLFGGRIALGDEIGRGAMGVVYSADLDEVPVAVKVLHPHLTSDLSVVGRFVREHQALSRIDHPNVVHVIELIIDDPRLGIVMEHLDYPDLGKVIAGEDVDVARAASMASGIASGVAAIHDARVVHRDLKPANVIVAQDQFGDVPKIADFGVSRLVGQSIASSTTTLGTPLYMSPEAAGGSTPIGRPADVYSLGIILYEMLIGRPPYTAEEPIAIAVAHVNNPVPQIGGVPDELSDLLSSMLDKDPLQRPEAATVAETLKAMAAELDPDLEPFVVEPVIDLTATEPSAMSPTFGSLSTATVPIGAADQTVAGVRPEAPAFGGFPVTHPTDTMASPSLEWAPTQSPSPGSQPVNFEDPGLGGQSPSPNRQPNILQSGPVGPAADNGYGSQGGFGYPPPNGTDQRPPLGGQPPPSYRHPISNTTASSVERRWLPWVAAALLLLLLPLGWLAWTQLRSESSNTDLTTTNAAYSFVPRVSTDGLITTRRWELTLNSQGQAIIEAEVILTNTSDDPIEATHYEAFPEVVDVDYLINTFSPEPDRIVADPGVAIFDLGDMAPRSRFLMTYRMLAPDGVTSVEELQALADSQSMVEIAYIDSLPSEEAVETEAELAELRISPSSVTVAAGDTTSPVLLGALSDGNTIDPTALEAAVWTIGDPEIAEISEDNATIRGLKTGETTLTVAVGDIEVTVDLTVTAPDNAEVAGPSTTKRPTTSTNSTATTATTTASTTTDAPTTSASTTSSSSTSASTSTTDTTSTSSTSSTTSTTLAEPTLTMTALSVAKRPNGSFKISFSTNLCTIANYQSDAGHSYVTPGWPVVGETCWQDHGQTFASMGPGTYQVTVRTRSKGGQLAQRRATVIIEDAATTTSTSTSTTEPDGP